MTTIDRTRTYKPADLGLEPEFMEAVAEMSRRNDEFYAAHQQEIWQQHAGKCVLIHSGSTVEVFDEVDDLMARLTALDPVAGSSSLHWYPTERLGIW